MREHTKNFLIFIAVMVCSAAMIVATVGTAHAAVTNFDDHMGNGGYATPWMVNGILIDFDQDGVACGGTATEYNIFVNQGSVGSETDPVLLVQGTSTLVAGHEQHTVQVADSFNNGATIPNYYNLQMDYSDGGVVCERESSVGFGAQSWRYTSGTNEGWTRNSPGAAHDAVTYAFGTAFDVLMDMPSDTTLYPQYATDYQVIGGGFCFPEHLVGADTTYNTTLPDGDYSNLAIVFASDASVDGNGCLTSTLGFVWPVANTPDYYDSFIVGSGAPTTTPTDVNKSDMLFMFGLVIFLGSIPMWDRILTVSRGRYDL